MLGRSVVHWFLETETFDDSFPSVVRHSPRERSAIIRLHEDPKRFAKRVIVVLSIIISTSVAMSKLKQKRKRSIAVSRVLFRDPSNYVLEYVCTAFFL